MCPEEFLKSGRQMTAVFAPKICNPSLPPLDHFYPTLKSWPPYPLLAASIRSLSCVPLLDLLTNSGCPHRVALKPQVKDRAQFGLTLPLKLFSTLTPCSLPHHIHTHAYVHTHMLPFPSFVVHQYQSICCSFLIFHHSLYICNHEHTFVITLHCRAPFCRGEAWGRGAGG